MLSEIIGTKGKYALVGLNSQGKTHALREFYKKHKKTTIFIENESKADEALKVSTNTSPLVEWLERLLDLDQIKELINSQIKDINISSAVLNSNLNIRFDNAVSNYKGLISAKIETRSNQWSIPGSGETFLGELLLVEQMISQGKKNPIKYLLIDEPETFLHSNLYLTVTSILKRLSQKMTVVISTHSPELLELYTEDMSEIIMVQDGILHPLLSDNEYVSMTLELDILNPDDSNMDKQTRTILQDYSNYFRYFVKPIIIKCLFSKVIVLGEGAAENALFECMRRYYSEEKFTGYTAYYGLYGKNLMPAFILILKNIGIKVMALFDYDREQQHIPWKAKINEFLMNQTDAYYYFDDEIEVYLGYGKTDKRDKGVKIPILIQTAFLNRDSNLLLLMEELAKRINIVLEKEAPANSDL